jgi:hypothetical protein
MARVRCLVFPRLLQASIADSPIHSLGDVINRWRESIQLEPVNMADGPSLMKQLKVPFTYCWSPSLVPKPNDWPDFIGDREPTASLIKVSALTCC